MIIVQSTKKRSATLIFALLFSNICIIQIGEAVAFEYKAVIKVVTQVILRYIKEFHLLNSLSDSLKHGQ